MAVSDRRVKRTQRLLAEALISLTLEKGYHAVSIRDITERADVAYATFFRHYDDKDALLDEVLDVILDDMLNILHPPPEESPVTAAIKIFEFVQAHSELARVLLGSKGKDDLIQQLLANKQYFAPKASGDIPPEIATYHFMSSSIEMIKWWLDHDMPYAPEKMGQVFATLILLPSQELSDPC